MRMKSETMKMANGGTVDKIKKKIKDNLKKLAPKKTGPAGFTKKSRDMLKERLKQKDKNKIKDLVKKKVKQKSKGKSTKGGILSKAGIAPVSAPGGIPVVQSQKTAQKDLKPKRRPTPGKEIDRMPRPPKGFPDNPSILRPKNPPRKFIPLREDRKLSGKVRKAKDLLVNRASGGEMKSLKKAADKVDSMLKNIKKNPGLVGSNKGIMDLARKLKPTGRLSTTDLARARRMLAGAFGTGKGQKPVFKTGTKEKVKGLTQKANKVKLTPAQKKKLQGMMGAAGKGMRKAFGGKNMRSAARKMKRIM